MSLVIALQFWAGDRDQAMRLARFMADIEPRFRHDVQLMLVNRYDCEVVDDETLIRVAEKFDVKEFQTTTRGDGWPAGPNAMACDVFAEATRRVRSGEWRAVHGLLMLEPDCVPLSADWINLLNQNWITVSQAGSWIMGAWRPSGGHLGHINGACMIRPDIGLLCDLRFRSDMVAWDCDFMAQWGNRIWGTDLIVNIFQETNVDQRRLDPSPITGIAPAFAHGAKDQSVWDYARQKLLP